MKKIFLIFSVFLFVFPSCETDFDVHATWKEITVVYGLLDQNQDRQYIKINKAYLGAGDALQMANIADSINFSPEEMLVVLYKLHTSGDILSTLTLYDTIIEKEDGSFSIDNNIIYTAKNNDALTVDSVPDLNFFTSDNLFALTIENKESGNFVSANTELVGVPSAPLNFVTSSFPPSGFAFVKDDPNLPDSLRFHSKTIAWNAATNGETYQVDILFNYKENNLEKSLTWRQPLIGNSLNMKTVLEGGLFFNFLGINLVEDNSISREFISIDLVITVGTSDLATYITINAPLEGIVQSRPPFTNINNGIGLFSSRYKYEKLNVGLSAATQYYLIHDLNRNFQ